MSKLRFRISMSLDGFDAAPGGHRQPGRSASAAYRFV
jgi:hypothetical protein